MPAADIYTSTPLLKNEKSIRLLTLEPSRRPIDALVSTLDVASIAYPTEDLLPSYHALSYVWGNYHSPKDTLRCGTVDIPITRNCRDALRAVRSLYKTPITIWVDAICINQADIMEKEQQIEIMSDIYIWAYVVDIWLGEGSNDSWQAMKWLEKAAETNYLPLERIRAYRDPTLPQSIELPREMSKTTFRRVSSYYYSVDPDEFERCMDDFLRREWFLRAWTFQEAILSSHSRLICGDKYLDWDTVVQGMAVLRFNHRDDAPKTVSNQPVTRHPQPRSHNIHPRVGKPIRLSSRLRMLERFVQIWMHIKRPQLRAHSSRYALDPNAKHSAYGMQSALTNYFRRNTLYERFSSHARRKAFFLGSLAATVAWCSIFLLTRYLTLLLDNDTHIILIVFISTVSTGIWSLVLLTVSSEGRTYLSLDLDKNANFLDFLYPEDGNMEDTRDILVEGMVNNLRQRKAERPHDKSYAMYGVLHTMGLQLAKIDYTKSIGQTYHELMVDLLRWSSAALIVLLDTGDRLCGAPSWVPDWSQIPPEPTIPADYFLSPCHRLADATRGSKPSFTLAENTHVLITLGYKQDIIAFSTRRLPQLCYSSLLNQHVGTRLLFNEAVEIFACWIQAVRNTTMQRHPLSSRSYTRWEWTDEDGYKRSSNVPDITRPSPQVRIPKSADYSRLPCQVRIREPTVYRVQSNIMPCYEALTATDIFLVLTRSSQMFQKDAAFHELGRVISCFPKCIFTPLSPQNLKTTTASLLSNEKTLETFVNIVNGLALNHRRLFTTHSGYLGCGSHDVEKGDNIALIAGIPAPMILRQKGPQNDDSTKRPGQYQVICAAFVLGLMDGSAWRFDREEVLELV